MDEARKLSGQVAIVTGGASGIGRATCAALAREGACLTVVDVNQTQIRQTLEEISAQSNSPAPPKPPLGLFLDVRREHDMEEMVGQTVAHFGHLDILVASAGILRAKGSNPRLVVDLPTAEWEEVIDTNLTGVFLSNRAVLPTMIRQRKGQIVNISSTSGRQGHAYDSAYCASKFGIVGLSEALAEEVYSHNIRVQVVFPDAVDTPLWDQNGPIPKPMNTLPVARIADLIVYLLTLPADTLLVNPIIAPCRTRRRRTQLAAERREGP
ncbi:MAG: SDR family oxidoreductase [Verrucomicrobiales bacterium]|nr:SDR family oxidoreductase [Verrucomicrobiales bacterium]